MKIQSFESWLEEKFDENNEIGGVPITKDNCEAMADSWFENLDVQELIDYGQEYAKYVQFETISELQDQLCTQANTLHDELNNFSK